MKLKIDSFSFLVIDKCIRTSFKAAIFYLLDEQLHMSVFSKVQVVLVDKEMIYFCDCRSFINSSQLVNLGAHFTPRSSGRLKCTGPENKLVIINFDENSKF